MKHDISKVNTNNWFIIYLFDVVCWRDLIVYMNQTRLHKRSYLDMLGYSILVVNEINDLYIS